MMQVQNACSTCHGSGRIYTKDGKKVAGGVMTVEQTLSVKVPEGIQDGVMIRYTGMGHESVSGGAGGDVYVKIQVQFPEGVVRKQDDLYMKIDVTLFDLVLGGEVRIDHPTGMLDCKIPKGTQPTDLIKISNK
jgi:DnaJ-class molecular chaperone